MVRTMLERLLIVWLVLLCWIAYCWPAWYCPCWVALTGLPNANLSRVLAIALRSSDNQGESRCNERGVIGRIQTARAVMSLMLPCFQPYCFGMPIVFLLKILAESQCCETLK